METAPVESRPGSASESLSRRRLFQESVTDAPWCQETADTSKPQTCTAVSPRAQASKQPEPRRLGMARSVSPTRAGSPGRKSASRGRPDAIVGLSEDELKSFAGSGSLPIDEDELSAAFDFFDVEGRGKLTVADLKLRLGAFYKNLPVRRRLHCHLGCQPAPALTSLCLSPAQGVQDPDQRAQLHQGNAEKPAG